MLSAFKKRDIRKKTRLSRGNKGKNDGLGGQPSGVDGNGNVDDVEESGRDKKVQDDEEVKDEETDGDNEEADEEVKDEETDGDNEEADEEVEDKETDGDNEEVDDEESDGDSVDGNEANKEGEDEENDGESSNGNERSEDEKTDQRSEEECNGDDEHEQGEKNDSCSTPTHSLLLSAEENNELNAAVTATCRDSEFSSRQIELTKNEGLVKVARGKRKLKSCGYAYTPYVKKNNKMVRLTKEQKMLLTYMGKFDGDSS